MIVVYDIPVSFPHFPDGTIAARLPDECGCLVPEFTWLYDSDEEAMQLWYLVKYFRERGFTYRTLHMPYVPNARMDRMEASGDIFTLKYFAEFINSMEFDTVHILDPHSNVTSALFDRIRVDDGTQFITKTMNDIHDTNLLLCYPDNGAEKKYSKLLQSEYVYGIKHRDWKTGQITSFTLTAPERVSGKNVLIVDDICSRGGTFMHTARALKEAGANDIYLHVSHCENTIHDGDVLNNDLIKRVYTTNSIYRRTHDKITVHPVSAQNMRCSIV